jgi:brefeldin A-inhibited guanine nucleotide-exchange protein
LPILEMRTSTIKQKSLILNVFFRLSQDPQALVELYLNYDCDRTAVENIYERLVEIIAKVGSTHFAPSASGKEEVTGVGGVGRNEGGRAGVFDKGPVIPPSLTTSAMSGSSPGLSTASGPGAASDSASALPSQQLAGHAALWANLPPEVKLRRQALECLVTILRSLVQWGIVAPRGNLSESESRRDSEDQRRESTADGEGGVRSGGRATPAQIGPLGPAREDDPETFENAKQRKTTLMEGIKKFNSSPKKVRPTPPSGASRSS